MRHLLAAAVLVAALAGCSDGGGQEGAVPDGPGVTLAEDASTTTQAVQEQRDGDPGTAEVVRPEDGVLTDGVWAVGEAGTVEFAVTDAGLELIEVVAADGWSAHVDEEAPDEIEVDFRRGDTEYEIELEYEGGVLEIEIDLDIDGAEPGTFDLGPAGTVTLERDAEVVALVDLAVADGWTVTEQDTSDGEVEVELRRDAVTWEATAEVDDGRLDIEIDFEIEGRYP